MHYQKQSSRRNCNLWKQSTLDKKDNEHAKVILPPSWSGLISVGRPSQTQLKGPDSFSIGLLNIDAHPHFQGVIFRNVNPIEEIRPYKPYSTNKDVLKSLKSLDNRLQKEYQSSFLIDKESDSFGDDGNLACCLDEENEETSQKQSPQYLKDVTLPRKMIREFDITRISPRNKEGMDESPTNYNSLSRETSASTISSLKLNLLRLNSSHSQYLKSNIYQIAPSIYSDHSDMKSHASSIGPLMFTSNQSRKEVYDAFKSPRFSEEQFAEVSQLLRQLCDNEGKRRNKRFEEDLLRLCDVVNAILQYIPPNILPFKVKRFAKDCTFETVGAFSYDFYLEGEICYDDLEISFRKGNSNIADIFLIGNNPTLELFCVEDALVSKRKLSPCKLMIMFSHIISAIIKDSVHEFPHNASVSHENISSKDIHIFVTFPERYPRFSVNFILGLDVDEFPSDTAFKRRRQWPSTTIKQQVQRSGVHLTSKVNDINIHSWTVSFIKSRRTLLQLTDETGNKLQLLLALQCLRETRLAVPAVILPAHFATILFWANIKYPTTTDWSTAKFGKRFIDLILAMKRCLWRHECLDFFVTHLNMLETLSVEDCQALSFKIDFLIKDPVGYLKGKLI